MGLYRSKPSSPAIAALPACADARRQMMPHAVRSSLSATGTTLSAPQLAAARVHRVGASQLSSPNLLLLFDAGYPHSDQFYPWHLYNCLANLVSGTFAQGLRQYGAGPGRYAGYAEPVFPAGTVGTDQLAAWLDQYLAGTRLPDQALYLLFPGPATNLGDSGFRYGVDFCAYHTVTEAGIPYGVMPYPIDQPGPNGGLRTQDSGLSGARRPAPGGTQDPRGLGLSPESLSLGPRRALSPPWGTCGQALGLSDLDILTMVSAHELAEAMTDTVPGEGEDGPEGEIDDFAPCLWAPLTVSFGGWSYRIQAYWDESAGACWAPAASPPGSPSPASPAMGRRPARV